MIEQLLDSIGRGNLSVAAAYRLADAVAQEHGISSHAVRAFVSLGNSGENRLNIERDLHRWIANTRYLNLEEYWIKLPLVCDEAGTVEEVLFPVICPHEILYALWRAGDDHALFYEAMLGDKNQSSLVSFWDRCMMQPWGPTHPCARSPQDFHRTFPLLFHCDGAEAYSVQEALIYSISSPFAKHINVYIAKYLCVVLMMGDIEKPGLWPVVNRILADLFSWSLGVAETGIMPSEGFYKEPLSLGTKRGKKAGEPIAGGNKFVYFGWTGDKKAKKEAHCYSRLGCPFEGFARFKKPSKGLHML